LENEDLSRLRPAHAYAAQGRWQLVALTSRQQTGVVLVLGAHEQLAAALTRSFDTYCGADTQTHARPA
jgi:hypothetical protein